MIKLGLNQDIHMPIFEYQCNNCNKIFETLVLGGDSPACPQCQSEDLAKQLSMCGFVSKSSGPGGVQTVSAAGSSACSGCSATNCSSCTTG